MKHPWNLLDLVHLKGKCKFFLLMEDFQISLSCFVGGDRWDRKDEGSRGIFWIKKFH